MLYKTIFNYFLWTFPLAICISCLGLIQKKFWKNGLVDNTQQMCLHGMFQHARLLATVELGVHTCVNILRMRVYIVFGANMNNF